MRTISRALVRSTSSPVPEAASSADCCADGVPSAPSSLTPSAARSWLRDRTTEAWSRSLYGTTYALLTDGPGAAAVTSCVAAFRVSRSLRSASVPASGESTPASGARWPVSSTRSSPAGFSLRTPPTSSSSDSTSSYRILTRAGTMRSGCVFPRPSSEPPTSGTGYGYLPNVAHPDYLVERERLKDAIACLKAGRADVKLPEKAFAFWPTPTHSDAKNTGSPTQLLRRYIPLSCRVRIAPDGSFDATGGRTNPTFVEWLMAWPLGWTDLRPLATDRLRTWRNGRRPSCSAASAPTRLARNPPVCYTPPQLPQPTDSTGKETPCHPKP